MKRILNFKMIMFLLLVILAFASAAYALRPFVFGLEKAVDIQREAKRFYEIVEQVQQKEEVPYAQLRTHMERHNQWLYDVKQGNLTGPQSYEEPLFKLSDYGLEDEVFGVISIPKMEVVMPIYLGASEENMANGAAVLSQTSVPIGGESTNSVIAGHRGWQGYKYFKDIDLLEVGDEIIIQNLWETLTYKVAEIKIITPNNIEAILIQPGRDLVTLLTCHPYASGGKYRYLVFCERSESDSGGEEPVFLP